jgi:pyrroloquinoline quinone biosynthesis protein B
VLGLFSLREGARFKIHATRAVRDTLSHSLGLEAVLDVFCGSAWHEPPTAELAPLAVVDGKPRLLYRAIELTGKAPPYSRVKPISGIHSVAYEFVDAQTEGRLIVAPDVGVVNDRLREALSNSTTVLFDGTFWSADELARLKGSATTANEMGHVTIKDCSLELLRRIAARRKIYIHINNTNPILAPGSPERAQVEAAGIIVGCDGFEFEL